MLQQRRDASRPGCGPPPSSPWSRRLGPKGSPVVPSRLPAGALGGDRRRGQRELAGPQRLGLQPGVPALTYAELALLAADDPFAPDVWQARRIKPGERTHVRAIDWSRIPRQGEAVTFASVGRASGVSRSFLNKVPALAGEIRRLRALCQTEARHVPAAQRMSDASKDARIAQLTEADRKVREEVGWVREQNAVLLGRLRGGPCRS